MTMVARASKQTFGIQGVGGDVINHATNEPGRNLVKNGDKLQANEGEQILLPMLPKDEAHLP